MDVRSQRLEEYKEKLNRIMEEHRNEKNMSNKPPGVINEPIVRSRRTLATKKKVPVVKKGTPGPKPGRRGIRRKTAVKIKEIGGLDDVSAVSSVVPDIDAKLSSLTDGLPPKSQEGDAQIRISIGKRGAAMREDVAMSGAVKTLDSNKMNHWTKDPPLDGLPVTKLVPGPEHTFLCPEEETIINDTFRVLDQSYLVGGGGNIIDATHIGRRRARRRTGLRVKKRMLSEPVEMHEPVKKLKTEPTPSYLIEHYKILREMRIIEESAVLESVVGEDVVAQLRRRKRRARAEHRAARKLKEDMEKELLEVRAIKERLVAIETAHKEEAGHAEIKQVNELRQEIAEALRKEMADALGKEVERERMELERIRREREDETQIFEEYRKFIENERGRASGPLVTTLANDSERREAVSREEAACIKVQLRSKSSAINDFFKAARDEHIEKINRTMVSRTFLCDKGETAARAIGGAAKPPALAVELRPHTLYKRSIDKQAVLEDPKNYVPKTPIPFYASEEEFSQGDKKFEPAAFTKDPRLYYNVRKQNHNAIRALFGNQTDIDVEAVFNSVENVTNESPNKLIRRK